MMVRIVERGETEHSRLRGEALEQEGIGAVDPERNAELRLQRGHGSHVIQVSVGVDDRERRHAGGADRGEDARRLVAGIDDVTVSSPIGAEEIRVLLERPHGDGIDLHVFTPLSRRAPARRRLEP